jgi:hypothetical protein
VAARTGSGDGGGTRVAARVRFCEGIGRGCVGEVHPSLYRVWEESGWVTIRVRDKI